ncbi:hypothetical protein INT45_013344 [Circinella minor]|uniref:F-box domain-containing protein n=1 Tax=Circinella minor TaxID=1195481 RepID=A0A8H7VJE7_9FUNG|nr:hypothetical protein INT45_013344 [Circinella minor]
MSIALPVTAATTIINTALPSSSFEKVKNAYKLHDYDEIIRQATHAITHIEQLELLFILDQRAHALSRKGQFGAAEHDAETMIKYAPTLPQGYLCLGQLLSMQGKQKRASKVYQEGLEKIPTNDLVYGQLLQAKKRVDETKDRHFDLMSALPIEIKDEIVKLLSQDEKFNIFDVSTTWSEWLENCQVAWKYVCTYYYHVEDMTVLEVLPKIGKHIHHLTLTGTSEKLWLKYFEHFENGLFCNLKWLDITGQMFADMHNTNLNTSLMNGFWKTRYSLTKLVLQFFGCGTLITIRDILLNLPYLETLVFRVRESLADVLGEPDVSQEPHRSLVNLILYAQTSGDALKQLTKWCPYIRQLSLEQATPDALDIVTDYFPNVEMLGYNSNYGLPAPHDVLNQDYNNNEPIIPIIGMNNQYIKQQQGRLRAFYSSNGWDGVPGDAFLRLLQKNQKTLEIIHANMSIIRREDTDIELDDFRPDYVTKTASVVLHLDRLEKLMCWPDIYGAYESLFCRTIGPSLKYFKPFRIIDLSALVDTLIHSRQLLETLVFRDAHIKNDNQDKTLATQCWLRLLNHYAVTSLPGPNTTKKLRRVIFEYCDGLSDSVLDALANIKTIKGVGFQSIANRITPQGFKDFFIKLNMQNRQVTSLTLGNMENVVDRNMFFDIMSIMEELEELYLYQIPWLTEDDIKSAIHSAKKLNTLVVKRCDIDSEHIISFINKTNRKFESVKIINYYDDEFDTHY